MRLRIAVGLVSLVASCASSSQQNTLQQLQESVEGYNEAYRWKNYERAASFLPEDLRQAFLATYEDADNSLHVEDYQVLNVKLESDEAATVTLRVRYMQLPSVNVDRKTLVQHWHKLGGSWILETEDNSIRDLDKTLKPRNPEATEQKGASKEQEGDTKVKVTNPSGETIRKDGEVDSDAPQW